MKVISLANSKEEITSLAHTSNHIRPPPTIRVRIVESFLVKLKEKKGSPPQIFSQDFLERLEY